MTHEVEMAASVWWCNEDKADPDLLVSEFVLLPVKAFIGTEQNMIRGFFVIHRDQDRSRIAKFPQMSVFVDFFPSKASVATKNSVTLRQLFTHIPNGHE